MSNSHIESGVGGSRIAVLGSIFKHNQKANSLMKTNGGTARTIVNGLEARPKLSTRPDYDELVLLLRWEEKRLEALTDGFMAT